MSHCKLKLRPCVGLYEKNGSQDGPPRNTQEVTGNGSSGFFVFVCASERCSEPGNCIEERTKTCFQRLSLPLRSSVSGPYWAFLWN